MSIINLHNTLKQAQCMRNDLTTIKTQVDTKSARVDDLHDKLTCVTSDVANVVKSINDVKDVFVSKKEFSEITDEISSCIQEFIMTGNTPRPNNGVFDELELRVASLEAQMQELQHHEYKQANDIDAPINKIVFKRPAKPIIPNIALKK